MSQLEERIVSFSIKPFDTEGVENVKLLKTYAKNHGISLSYLILSSISQKITELGLK